jgi:RNA polymerase sigma-70 factor (ECF subfamily)
MNAGGSTPLPGPLAPPRENESWLDRVHLAGRQAWPSLPLDPAVFAQFLRRRGILVDVPASLAADLYLACACEAHTPGSISAFMQAHRLTITAAASAFDTSPSFVDEVEQRLAEILFVGAAGSGGRIGQYSGQGSLSSWVATAARRIAVRLMKANASGKFVGEEALAKHFSGTADPDLAMLRGQYKLLFDQAIVLALRRLSPRERLILRLHMVEQISMDRIAKMHNVSQPTISRWLQRARVEILRTVRDLVRTEVNLDDGEFDSLLRALRSQVDFSFSRLLADNGEGETKPRE